MNVKKYLGTDNRTIKARKNIIASFFLKGIDLLIYLFLVPITLGYLNPYEYGVWLTLNSILMWINSFDIGLGNGMRNKLATAMANNDKEKARTYVSTTFFMLIAVMCALIVIGLLFSPYINWYRVLGTDIHHISNLNEIVLVSFILCCITFIFRFIGNVYQSLQMPAISGLITVLGHLLSLIVISILTIYTSGSLFFVALAYTCSPVVVYLIAYPVTFYKVYKFLRPSLKMFRKEYLKDLFSIGVEFFMLQLSGILLFSIANILISRMFGPDKVTPYNIAYRYFSLIPMGMNLILTPMWSATTDAYYKGDIEWIKQSMSYIKKCLYGVYLVLGLMVVVSPFVYRVWIGTDVNIPFSISALMAVYIAILQTSLSYSNFLNGLGKLRIQTINTLVVAIISCPLFWILGRSFNVPGLLMGMCLVNLPGVIFNIIQFKKVMSFQAEGIWNK